MHLVGRSRPYEICVCDPVSRTVNGWRLTKRVHRGLQCNYVRTIELVPPGGSAAITCQFSRPTTHCPN